MSTNSKKKQAWNNYFAWNNQKSTSSYNNSGRSNEKVTVGHLIPDLATLWPSSNGKTTNYLQWIQQILPYIGRETSSRVQAALRRKQYFPAAIQTFTRDEEKGMSKTEISAQEDLNKENALNSRQLSNDHIKCNLQVLVVLSII